MFWKDPLEKNKSLIRKVLKSTKIFLQAKNLTPGKILITKTWLKFWGVTITTPLKKKSRPRDLLRAILKRFYSYHYKNNHPTHAIKMWLK